MKPKTAGMAAFALISLFASVAFASNSTSQVVTAMMSPYVIVTALILMAYRKRWLEGSWKRWWKQLALSVVLTGFGLGIGFTAMITIVAEFGPRGCFGNPRADAAVLFSTPLLFIAGQLSLLKVQATRKAALDD